MVSGGQLPRPPAIEAISRLADLEDLATKFERSRGYAPELISHWDPKAEFGARIERHIRCTPTKAGSLVDYVYSGYLGVDSRIRERLYESGDRALLLTPSGTTSIANILAYLKNIGCAQLHIVAPSYFAVEAVAAVLDIKTSFSDVVRREGHYSLPAQIDTAKISAVWLTLPIYGASCYISPTNVAAYIDALPDHIIVVVDEGLGFTDRPSLSATRTMWRVIRVSTPHKSICINGEKVSIITFPAHLADDLDAWSECFAGGIGAGGANALRYLASDDYDRAVAETRELSADRFSRLKTVLCHNSVSLDDGCDGHFITVYWPGLPMLLGEDRAFLASIIDESGCVPMPSSRNRHPGGYGFAFRVNLLRLDDGGLGGLARLGETLDRRL